MPPFAIRLTMTKIANSKSCACLPAFPLRCAGTASSFCWSSWGRILRQYTTLSMTYCQSCQEYGDKQQQQKPGQEHKQREHEQQQEQQQEHKQP